jgi:hypothetical protein
MSYIGTKDYNLEVLRGNVAGSTMVSITGRDTALTTSRITVAPTSTTANIDQSGIHTTPATVDVASTSANDDAGGSGLLTLTLMGLDASGDAQTETITMDGQTEVTSSNTYSAVNGWRGLTWGATTWNEGTIWVGNGTFTAGVPATEYIAGEIRANRDHTAYYTVPTGKTLYLRQFTPGVATSNKDVEFFVEVSANGINWFTEQEFTMETFIFQGDVIAVPGIPAGWHVRIEALSSAAATDVTVILGCQLVDD